MMKICLKRANDRDLLITVTQDGEPQDITGWIIYFSVKKRASMTDAEAIIFKTVTVHTNPTEGLSQINIDAVDTIDKAVGDYRFDLLFVDNTGERQSSETGLFILEQEVTDGS